MAYVPRAVERPDRYRVRVDEYVHYQRYGYLKVEQLLPVEDVHRLLEWAESRRQPPPVSAQSEKAPLETVFKTQTRVHQLHRIDATAEWGLLHPRVLDVLEALIGPDVLALQSMLFFNPPGLGGQGWHQDAYYITTYPDTLIGAWMALDRADEANGCLWVIPGSHCEPIYPPSHPYGLVHAEGAFGDLFEVENVSHLDDEVNTLTKVVRKYPDPIPVPMEPGDVLFFHGHILHRSYPNRTTDRFRRSYVCHYCNARSWVPWNHGEPYEGDSANYLHILARGSTHLPYAQPKFGTPVHLRADAPNESTPPRMMGMEDGMMDSVQTRV
ncbi:MAG: phytanoyl-CoA dioxygenase family protein [Armatimonadota bacterium]